MNDADKDQTQNTELKGDLTTMPKPLVGEEKIITLLAMFKRWVNSQKHFNDYQMEKMMEELEQEGSTEERIEIAMGRFETILDNYKMQVKAGKSMLTRAGLNRGHDHRSYVKESIKAKVDKAVSDMNKSDNP